MLIHTQITVCIYRAIVCEWNEPHANHENGKFGILYLFNYYINQDLCMCTYILRSKVILLVCAPSLITVMNSCGQTKLHIATHHCQLTTAKLLLKIFLVGWLRDMADRSIFKNRVLVWSEKFRLHIIFIVYHGAIQQYIYSFDYSTKVKLSYSPCWKYFIWE